MNKHDISWADAQKQARNKKLKNSIIELLTIASAIFFVYAFMQLVINFKIYVLPIFAAILLFIALVCLYKIAAYRIDMKAAEAQTDWTNHARR